MEPDAQVMTKIFNGVMLLRHMRINMALMLLMHAVSASNM